MVRFEPMTELVCFWSKLQAAQLRAPPERAQATGNFAPRRQRGRGERKCQIFSRFRNTVHHRLSVHHRHTPTLTAQAK
jgi:hypothetical protein